MRFDEMELDSVPLGGGEYQEAAAAEEVTTYVDAGRLNRAAALAVDLSLFAALTLALAPLLPPQRDWLSMTALAGFVVIVSFYYFVGSWLLWGKTIGGAIFDIRVIGEQRETMSLGGASLRWAALYLSVATAGIGFLLALLPSHLSLADRLSGTRCVAAH